MVSGLPTMAIWVIVFYFVYKVIIVGSIYWVIKLGIRKLHDVLTKKKELDIINNEYTWDYASRICIAGDTAKRLVETALNKCKGKGISIGSPYIHEQSAQWLLDAITEKEQRETEQKAKENNNVW